MQPTFLKLNMSFRNKVHHFKRPLKAIVDCYTIFKNIILSLLQIYREVISSDIYGLEFKVLKPVNARKSCLNYQTVATSGKPGF